MIYIFTEDSRDGKELIESVVKILYPDYDIKVDTLQGIYNAVNKLKDKIEQNSIFSSIKERDMAKCEASIDKHYDIIERELFMR